MLAEVLDASNCCTAETQQISERFARDLRFVFSHAAQLCEEAGCNCLAQRFAAGGGQSFETCSCGCATRMDGEHHPLVHLLVKLVPLSALLSASGYHDLALLCARLAQELEPTLDLDLERALSLLALGETARAARIYARILQRLGYIPAEALRRLGELAAEHAAEDDISELYRELLLRLAA
jgi:hypothetical protein